MLNLSDEELVSNKSGATTGDGGGAINTLPTSWVLFLIVGKADNEEQKHHSANAEGGNFHGSFWCLHESVSSDPFVHMSKIPQVAYAGKKGCDFGKTKIRHNIYCANAAGVSKNGVFSMATGFHSDFWGYLVGV